MAPRRAGALDAAARSGGIADPQSQGSSSKHSAAWLAERHPALFRLHSAALSSLPELSQQAGTANAAITGAVEAALRDFPPQDDRRLELVRAASYFLNHADADSFLKAKEGLSRLAIGGPDANTASTEQLDKAWGSRTERWNALMHTLPQWLADVDAPGVEPLCDRLSTQWVGRGPFLREQAEQFMAARAPDGNWLPEGPDWLEQGQDRGPLIQTHRLLVIAGCSKRRLPSELIALAADLPALKGG